jgi:ATP-dependent DNA helicase PIF1
MTNPNNTTLGIILLLLAFVVALTSLSTILGVLYHQQKKKNHLTRKENLDINFLHKDSYDPKTTIRPHKGLNTSSHLPASEGAVGALRVDKVISQGEIHRRPNNSEIEITPEFKNALQLFNTNAPIIYVTGKAGTGKSTLLKYFIDCTNKAIALLAPTGMAALRVGGQTIHSFFGFPGRTLKDDDIILSRKRELYRKVETIVIDEISMVRADLLDRIDQFLRLNGNDPSKPFGGIQMIFFGDLYQLPPVVSTEEENQYISANYESPYFFSAHVLQTTPLQAIELTKAFRQKDCNFIEMLDAVRVNRVNEMILKGINSRCLPILQEDHTPPITLTSTNAIADRINRVELEKLSGQTRTFEAILEGEYYSSKGHHELPADYLLDLKPGAQIIFVKNDLNKLFLNGDMGKILQISENTIRVELERAGGKSQFDLLPASWEIIKYKYDYETRKIEPEVVGKYTQYPIRLGWAISVHKSQGATLNRTHIDLGTGAFATGQTYVALSRCKSLDGISLARPIYQSDIKTDSRIHKFMKSVVNQSTSPKKAGEISEIDLPYLVSPVEEQKRSLKPFVRIEEEEIPKYSEPNTGIPEWWAPDNVEMRLPIREDRSKFVNLRTFRGVGWVNLDDQFGWIANISDMMSAQALWMRIQDCADVTISIEGGANSGITSAPKQHLDFFIQLSYGVYKCETCGKMVMGYEKENHEQKVHGGKPMGWNRVK